MTTKVILHDLRSLLQQTLGDQIIIEKYSSETLLPPGENYGSTILKVHAVIRKSEQDKKEDLHLIAKMVPPTEFQRKMFDSPFSFRKEIAMYKEIIPAYNRLEIEHGIKENEIFDIVAKLYGSRLSLSPEVDFDDNAVILLENLKVRGYYCADRQIGFDKNHSKVAITAMARFHALGMAMKYKKPEYYKILKDNLMSKPFDRNSFKAPIDAFLKKMKSDPIIGPYHSKCEKHFNIDIWESLTTIPPEPWNTIVHSDFWVNNIMFHRDEQGQLDDIKFVDFQNYMCISPLRELIFFLFVSVDKSTLFDCIDEFIDLYRNTLVSILTKMQCDTTLLSRDNIDAQLPIDAKSELAHCLLMHKILVADNSDNNLDEIGMQNLMLVYDDKDEMFNEQVRKVILYFVEKNWI